MEYKNDSINGHIHLTILPNLKREMFGIRRIQNDSVSQNWTIATFAGLHRPSFADEYEKIYSLRFRLQK